MGAAARDPTAPVHFILAFWHFGILKSTRASTADPLPLAVLLPPVWELDSGTRGLGTRDSGALR